MKHEIVLDATVSDGLQRLGANIRIARIKRGLTAHTLASRLGIHRATYGKIESGDPTVSLGAYARVLSELGFGSPFAEIADPSADRIGLRLDIDRLPKRIRPGRASPQRRAPLGSRADPDVVKIGVIGAMTGPCSLWGLVSKTAAEVTAEMHNSDGGVQIGAKKLRVVIVPVDDGLDPSRTVAAVEWLAAHESVRYIIGPNVEQTIASSTPIAEKHNCMLFPYSATRTFYLPPHQNTVLSQIAGHQAWPVMFAYMREQCGARTMSVLATKTREGVTQRREAIRSADESGLRVLPSERLYDPGLNDLSQVVPDLVRNKPDVIVLANLAPDDAPKVIRLLREAGFCGIFAAEAAQDISVLKEGAGEAANGFFVLGGASTPAMRTSYMEDFMNRYRRHAGVWHDEAGTKAYALETILGTLRMAGRAALDDVGFFKRAIPWFVTPNPFVKGGPALQYVGTRHFKQKRQIDIPLVINVVRDGRFDPVYIGAVE